VSGTLFIRNRQRARAIDLRFLRCLTRTLLRDLLAQPNFELGIYLVARAEITWLNETFLQHQGSTDVITFDYGENPAAGLPGEIFICIDEAISQARKFRTTWQKELVRYIIHGVLHLCGHDDRRASARRRMKTQEDRLLRQLALHCDFRRLLTSPSPRGRGPG